MPEVVETSSEKRASQWDVAGYLAVLAASACWGMSGIFIKLIVASSGITALALAFWRDLLTSAVLWTGLKLLRPAWLRIRKEDLPWLAGLGGIGVGTFHVLWNLAVVINGAAIATVQQAAMPAIVAVAARLLWNEALTAYKLLAIALTFTGTVLISGLDAWGSLRVSPMGLLLGLGVPIAYSSYNLFGKKIAGRYHPLTILTYGFSFGALVLLPLQPLTSQPWPVPVAALPWFVGLLAIATILPFSFYTFGLGRLPASVAGILVMAEIFFASVFAYIILGERLSPLQILGAALVISGVLILYKGR